MAKARAAHPRDAHGNMAVPTRHAPSTLGPAGGSSRAVASFGLGMVCGWSLLHSTWSPSDALHARPLPLQPRPAQTPQTMIVLGVLSTEHLKERRQRLRDLYRDAHQQGVDVRYVLSAEWLAECATPRATEWCTEIHARGALEADEVAVLTVQPRWTRNRGPWEQLCSRERIMAFKTMGWLVLAQRWQASWYGVTDDDALVDLPPLLLLLRAAPWGPSWAGVVNYYYLNATSLHAARQNTTRKPAWLPRLPCHALGIAGALNLGQLHGCEGYGPYPFMLGSLNLMSRELHAWAVVPLQALLRRLEAVSCPPGGDALPGYVIAQHPALNLINLDGALGRFDIDWSRGRWRGSPSLLAHQVRTHEAFQLARRDINATRQLHGMQGGFTRYCATRPRGGSQRRWHREAQRRFCRASALSLPCQRWPMQDDSVRMLPCCHGWRVCTTPPPLSNPTRFVGLDASASTHQVLTDTF